MNWVEFGGRMYLKKGFSHMTKKKICIAMAGVVAVLAATLCACTIVPANGEYDITQGVTGSRGELTFTLASYNVHGGGRRDSKLRQSPPC